MHGARAAQSGAAAKSRSREPQIVTEIPEQRHVFVTVKGARRSIYCELDHLTSTPNSQDAGRRVSRLASTSSHQPLTTNQLTLQALCISPSSSQRRRSPRG